ncbi:hypothetical protein [Citrifermentans bemidjiense]|uniref:hypothetical protein n=1 Tax=Citrifermentans bemidjiense TaxID=225194 RepID=UPI000325BE07|nr:hypothetical protein [Citrifermentans bemidjiense]
MKRKFRLSPFTKSFRVRLYLIFTGTIALLTAAFVTFYVLTEINAYRSTLEREGRLLATILSQNARLPLFAENREALSALAEGTSRQSSVVSVLIIDQQGRVAAEARKVEIPQGETVKMEVEITSPSSVLSPESVLLGHQETDKQRVIGRVHLLLDMSAVRERLVNLVAASLAIGTLFWVAVSLLSYQVLKRVTSSFNMLMGGSRR